MAKNTIIIGYGKVGRVMAQALHAAGYPLKAVVSKTVRADDWLSSHKIPLIDSIAVIPSGAELILICRRDWQLGHAAIRLRDGGKLKPGVIVAHTAGAFSAEVLSPVREAGCVCMSFHPLQSFAGGEGADLLKGVTFGIDGDAAAVEVGRKLARDLGGAAYDVPPATRRMYHLGGVFGCNLLTALTGVAADRLREAGMDEPQALAALRPLMMTTLDNIGRRGLKDSITGPLKRGDTATLEGHQLTLQDRPETAELYRRLSLYLLDRLDRPEGAGEIRKALSREQ